MNLWSSFVVFQKVGNVGNFALLKFENKWDILISELNVNSKHRGKCQFALNLIQLSTISNLFLFNIVQNIITLLYFDTDNL